MRNLRLQKWVSMMLIGFLLQTAVWLETAPPAKAATLTVNNLADVSDGVCNTSHCTLREAMLTANNSSVADTIQFSLSGTIVLGSQLPAVSSAGGNMTIDGAGQTVKISGNHSSRVFFIISGANLTLRNLEIMNGYAPGDNHGGAIFTWGVLTTEHCTFRGNRAYNRGGAIYVSFSANLTDTSFISNTTDVGSGGAAFFADGTVSYITGGDFSSNDAGFSGGAIYNAGYLRITGTSFLYNHASGDDSGAIHNVDDLGLEGANFSLNTTGEDGGAIGNENGSLSVQNSKFFLNGADSRGGAIFIADANPAIDLRGDSFSNNVANVGGGVYVIQGSVSINDALFTQNDADSGDGGGGSNQSGSVYINRSTFSLNTADENGGGFHNTGMLMISFSTFTGNDAGIDGGGVWNSSALINQKIENSTFFNNKAVRGGAMFLMLSNATIRNCTISGNRATATDGGGGLFSTNGTSMKNSIIADSVSGYNCASGTTDPANGGNNIDSGTTCGFGSNNGSWSNTNPQLGSLHANGGKTQTMMPLNGSPAIEGVLYNAPNQCPDIDQRDYPRPFGDYCDIGAVEAYYRIHLPIAIRQ